MSQRLLQVDLLDAQARSSRVSMLLPGSLVLAETELRCSCRKQEQLYCSPLAVLGEVRLVAGVLSPHCVFHAVE